MGLMLSAVCVCGLICVPPAGAAETVSTFPDVTDAQVGRAVEALRTMGVIDGSGGRYEPEGNLTRAQFCKMAIEVMGKGDEAEAEASRTIFNDVPGRHWARGYVNLAATTTVGGDADGKGAARLMMGQGNGSFAPDRAITYAEAVTTLLRILGYSKQANSNWPSGAVATAASVGLDSGFTPPSAGDPITRAQAALLFCNLLTAPMEGGSKDGSFLVDYLGCKPLEKGALLLVSNTTAPNGQTGAVRVFATEGTHNDAAVISAANTPAAFLEGSRGTAVFDKQDKFLTFLPDAGSASRTITVASISGGVLTATDGTRYTPSNSTDVWDGSSSEKYASKYTSIQPGTSLTVCFTEAGAIDYLFIHGTSMSLTGGVMVAREKVSGNPFAQLTAGTVDYKIVKNGTEVTTSALRQYDVAAFDPTNKTLYVTDFRLTGAYESASPNTSMPTEITVLGKKLPVLDSAVADLKNLKLNSAITVLLTPDGKVAGAVSASTLRSNTVGYITSSAAGSETSAGSVTVKLLNAPNTGDKEKLDLTEVSGNFSGNPESYADCLVTVTGTTGGITLSRLSNRTAKDSLNMKTRMLGDAPLAENVTVFDRIASSGIQKVPLSAVTVDSVPAAKIVYQRANAAGEVDLLVLDDVTGDLYTYGIAKNGDTGVQGSGDMTYTNRTTTVTNSGSESLTVVGGTTYRDGQFIGLAKSLTAGTVDNYPRPASSIALKSVEKVTPANFNLSTGLFFSGSVELPIWEEGVQCYNAQTKTWFSSGETAMENLNACLAYSSNLTVYYDRDPAQGGKVRIVAAN